MKNIVRSAALLVLAATATATAQAQTDAPAPYTLTGHLDLTTRYYSRGLTSTYFNTLPGLGNAWADAPESERPALQWGADLALASGWYAGYYGSQINYSYEQLGKAYEDRSISQFRHPRSSEHDLYGGYAGAIGDWGYNLGLTTYLYTNSRHATAFETKAAVSYAGVTLQAQTLLNDMVWGNAGDTYWTLSRSLALPYQLTLTANLGWQTYHREGKYFGTVDTLYGTACPSGSAFIVNGCYAGNAPIRSGFRHLIVGVSQPLAGTPWTWTVQGIVGGKNRFGISQANRMVGTISYGF